MEVTLAGRHGCSCATQTPTALLFPAYDFDFCYEIRTNVICGRVAYVSVLGNGGDVIDVECTEVGKIPQLDN